MTAFVSVIIPTYHDWQSLRYCLKALEAQRYPQECFEILVVNNAPEEGPPADLSLPGNAVLLVESKPGSYAARNAAIRQAQGEILAFLDADCLPGPLWLEEGGRCLAADTAVSLVAGRVRLTYQGERLQPAECYEKAYAFRQQDNVSKGVSVTANLMVRRRVFDEVGLFDDSLMSGGDFEWTGRATSRGFKMLYCAESVVAHPARDSLHALVGKARRVSTGSRALYRESGPLSGWRRVAGNMAGDVALLWSRADMTWRERGWALLVLVYLKGIKVRQRLSLQLTGQRRGHEELRR